ncbi:CinA family protein, partial [Leucobacter sp. M11]
TVWLGISSRRGDRSVRLAAAGDREAIRRATVTAALDLLADELRALPAAG